MVYSMNVYVAGNQVCIKRGLDARRIIAYFEANGCSYVANSQDADVILAITCAFVESYVAMALRMLRDLAHRKARLVVYGCLPAMRPEVFTTLGDNEYLVTKNIEKIDKFFPSFTVPFAKIPSAHFPEVAVMSPYEDSGSCPIAVRNNIMSERAPGPYLIICEGCGSNCSYCSHPYALGRIKSKPLEQCLAEYQRLLAQGHRHVTIHANDPGSYGVDIGSSYPELLAHLMDNTPKGLIRWSLLDINPHWVLRYTEELAAIIQRASIQAMGIPLQSGSELILKKMRRTPRLTELKEILALFRKTAPSIIFMTHLIVGFPGETLADIEATAAFVAEVGFYKAFVFRFSPNPMTSAAEFKEQIPFEEIIDRQRFLIALLERAGVQVDAFT
jgi:MiaB/RimO family radical SAM methylthiotransferase